MSALLSSGANTIQVPSAVDFEPARLRVIEVRPGSNADDNPVLVVEHL
jgi:hypothetical protein